MPILHLSGIDFHIFVGGGGGGGGEGIGKYWVSSALLALAVGMSWKQIKWNVFVKCSSFMYDFIKYF